jgi:NAD+ synthase (glutamine-hydrolysing)
MKTIRELLNYTRTKRNFQPELWLKRKILLLEDYMKTHKLTTCVISVSGGIDSAVVFAICKYASTLENSNIKNVVAITQPIHSTDSIWKRSLELGTHFRHKIHIIDQTTLFDILVSTVDSSVSVKSSDFSKGQLKSYMRTPVNYYVAQLYSTNGEPAIVMGTGNYDEDGYLYYFCKAGDGVVDVQLISDLHKYEVFELAKHLDIPESIRKAKPSADLWEGQCDEDELGISYDFIELYTELLKIEEKDELLAGLNPEEYKEFIRMESIAVSIHRRNKHKINFPVNL